MSVIWICLFPLPVVSGGTVILSSLPLGWTLVVLAGHFQPLILVSRWLLSVLFNPALADPGWPMDLGPLVPGVLWVALLRGWLVCCGCDVLCGPSFPNYLLYCNSWWSGSLLFARNSCALHLNAFVLNIAHILLCILRKYIFRVWIWSIGNYHIWGSTTVSGLF